MEKTLKFKGKELKLTSLDKVFWLDEGYTKGDLIKYYQKISKYILPYLKNRPESLKRNPNGIKDRGFFQKEVGNIVPEWVKTIKLPAESAGKYIDYLVCNDEPTLLYMVQLGCIEINPWLSRIKKIDNPDFAVIDLDPEKVTFDKIIHTANIIKKILDEAGAQSYCKTSGSRGIHICIPLNAKYNFDKSKDFASLVAKTVNSIIPEITSLVRDPKKRQGKVYLDYLQNRKGQTIAAPYCVRPKPGATVSAPLKWNEVKKGLEIKKFTIKNMPSRLERLGDIFSGVLGKGINIDRCSKKLSVIQK